MTKFVSGTALAASFALSTALVASVSFFAAAPAGAAEPVTVQVPYSDLNVASSTGADALAHRVTAACEKPDIRNLQAVSAWQQCKDAALASAMEQLNSQGVAFDSAPFTAA